MHRAIGIIGYGNMGSAIGQTLKSKYQIRAFDKDTNKTKGLSGLIEIADDVVDLVNKVGVAILAVKPQDFDELLIQIKKYIGKQLVISIAAGISSGYIENKLGKVHVIRAMPNLPAKIKKGMICLCKGSYCDDVDLNFTKALFEHLGRTMIIEENLMDAATAISGSGPGFFYHLIRDKQKREWKDYAQSVFIPKLSEVAQEIGFLAEQAKILATETTMGSTALLVSSGLAPAELEIQVASKGGTTEAGLEELRGIESLPEAVGAALKRAKELSKK